MMRGRLTHAWHQKAKYLVNTKRLLSMSWKSCWDIACTYFNVKRFGPECVRAFISEPGIPNFLTPDILEEEVVRFIGRFDKPANRISIFYCGITVKQEGLITAFGIPYNYFLTTLHSILPFHFSTQTWRFSIDHCSRIRANRQNSTLSGKEPFCPNISLDKNTFKPKREKEAENAKTEVPYSEKRQQQQ